MADPTPQQWAATVLQRLGIRQTPGAVQALTGWARAEGGHWNNQAKFNPLNTTQPEPGAGNTGTQGNIKVYKDWNQGVAATVKTLRNGRYNGILSALQSGDPAAVANAIGHTPWGTSGSLVQRTIASTPRVAGVQPFTPGPGTGPTAPPRTSSSPVTTTRTVGGVDNSAQRGALIAQFLGEKGSDPLTFAMGIRGLQDTPGQTVTTSSNGAPPSSSSGAIANGSKLVSRANAIDAKKLPYQWGGGHGGKVDPYNAQPLDCSGAVSAVLGINPRVAAQFESWGQPGEGGQVTIYAKSTHVLMKLRGSDGQWHFFGTSRANPGGGAGWIPASAISPEYLKGFTVRHS